MKIKVLTFTSVLLYSLSFISFAGNESGLLSQIEKCKQISQADARLVCFDDLAKDTAITTALPVNNDIAPVPATIVQAQPSESQQVDDFAKEHLKKSSNEQGLDSISSSITKLKKLIRGQWVITLENGQKWQQKDSAKIKLKVGDTVRMKKAAMGAIYLYKEGSHRNIRVKRVK